ncbi:MAG: long-chain-fatty-acid--CoA ligase [Actinomycetota bacterium]|nr:long-chain-fatty-acid--CoA ligase [Actinomycetota bacterium]
MLTVPDIIQQSAFQYPDRCAIKVDDREFTFAEVDERANRLARILVDMGIPHGSRIAFLAMNEPEFFEIQIAAIRACVALVPLNFRLAVPELDFIMENSTPQLLITGSGFHDIGDQLNCPKRLYLGDSYEELLAKVDPLDRAPIDASSICSVLYTSGTTGRPKGSLISNQALWARIVSFTLEYKPDPGDVFLQGLPLFHIAANVSFMYAYNAATNIVVRDFTPDGVIQLLEEQKVTDALFVPTMINLLINHPDILSADLSRLDFVAYGASTIPPSVLTKAIEVFDADFCQLFGMTETSGCTALRPEDHDPVNKSHLLASAGLVAHGFEVRIVDDQDVDVPVGEVGEVICRGPALMDGYLDATEATASALRGGWMHTGDMGKFDDEGYLYITDRKKDMIISGGENIYPREVEDVLFNHESVHSAAVIGIPDEQWGEQVHAVVVLHPESALKEMELLIYARENLAGYKVPKSVEFVKELPMNATGKVLKKILREPYWEGHQRQIN